MNLPKPKALVALAVARSHLLDCARHSGLASEQVTLRQLDGRVLAQDLHAELSVPPHDNSAMDGYAVRIADLAPNEGGKAELGVALRIAAGDAPAALPAGKAARIFTGAPIPAGADAVVPQEDCEAFAREGQQVVRLPMDLQVGQHIRRLGEDVRAGAVVLTAGTVLTPAAVGLCASLGLATARVARRPVVALFSSGDELVEPGAVTPAAMPSSAIFNSNRYLLHGLLTRLGCEVQDFGVVPDQLDATKATLQVASCTADLVLTSGGVSVGEEDHLKAAVEALGEVQLWRLAIKPGKPFVYGRLRRGMPAADAHGERPCHYIGLPGNPVSTFVTFLQLVRPFLLQLQGHVHAADVPQLELVANFDWPQPDPLREEFLRVRRGADGLELYPSQGSGVLTSAAWADGLVALAPAQKVAKGDQVTYISLDALYGG